MEPTRKRPGRKPGQYKEFPFQKVIRMKAGDVENLADLAALTQVSEAEAARTAIREALERRRGEAK